VSKEKIAANGDFNLSSERYREGVTRSTNFPWRSVESLVETITPPSKIQKIAFGAAGRFPIIDQSQDAIAGWTNDESALVRPSKPLVIFGDHTCAIKLVETPFAQGADGIKILQTIDALDPRFLFQVLRARPLETDGYQRHYSKLKEHKIPLPPLELQRAIVVEIEGYQKVINGARAVLDHYRPHIAIHPDWPVVPLGDIADVKLGKMLDQAKHDKGKMLPYARNVSVRWGSIDTHDLPEMYFEEDELERFGLQAGDVLVCEGGEPGRAAVWDGRIPNLKYQKALHRVRFKVPFEPSVLVFLLQEMALSGALVGWLSGTTIKHLTLESFTKLPIPLPPLVTQQAIVAEIKSEQALVAANRKLVTCFEQKVQATLARIWGEKAPAALEA
jgi:type I restriction enzyme M protein